MTKKLEPEERIENKMYQKISTKISKSISREISWDLKILSDANVFAEVRSNIGQSSVRFLLNQFLGI
jgi:hypothetical protein